MTISLPDFISQLGSNPALLITVILTLGVIDVYKRQPYGYVGPDYHGRFLNSFLDTKKH